MIFRYNIPCPTLKRRVKIYVSIPKNFRNEDVMYDSLYMLDGQNIFKDNEASFGRSLRFGKYLAIMSTKLNKRICGVAIENAGSDLGRVNEYSPFIIDRHASDEWKKQNIEKNRAFTKDLFEVIIPFVEEHFPVISNRENRFIFGSSLGAMCATYLANNFDVFSVAGLFSNCPFLCYEPFYENLENYLNPNVKYFNYVGLSEVSDNDFDESLYFDASVNLHNYFKEHGVYSKLVVDVNGTHSEATWEKHILEFLSFIYFDDVLITQ